MNLLIHEINIRRVNFIEKTPPCLEVEFYENQRLPFNPFQTFGVVPFGKVE